MTPDFTIPPRLQEVARDGHCKHYPELDWFTESEARVARCVAICNGCPVRERCAEHAVTWPEKYGIWGGTTPADRGHMHRHDYRRKKK